MTQVLVDLLFVNHKTFLENRQRALIHKEVLKEDKVTRLFNGHSLYCRNHLNNLVLMKNVFLVQGNSRILNSLYNLLGENVRKKVVKLLPVFHFFYKGVFLEIQIKQNLFNSLLNLLFLFQHDSNAEKIKVFYIQLHSEQFLELIEEELCVIGFL